MSDPIATEILIIGAGFGGIAAAIELREHGYEDITILERGPGIGGTWMWNTYPGAACDVPSHLYSLSYEQRRDWSRLCSPQEEILAYARAVAERHDVTGLVRCGRTVRACRFDERRARWIVETVEGERYDAAVLIVATGQLDRPVTPAITGAERFAGTSFHSARWRHDVDLRGADIAVIGNGASAVQFVPEIAGLARRLTVFQRTGNWLLPRRNRPYPRALRAIIARSGALQRLRRRYIYLYTEALTQAIRHPRTLGSVLRSWSTLFMRAQLRGHPELARRIWPDYQFGCKRVLFSSFWLPTLTQPHVTVETDRIAAIEPDAVVTAAGTRHHADIIIYATGFDTTHFLAEIAVTGTGGRALSRVWERGAHAHLGMTVPGFPSMFLLYGPNTNTSGGSILVYLESQVRYVRQALDHLRAARAAAIEVREEVEAASDRALQERFAGTAWLACDSWYRNEDGRIVTNWPGSMREYEACTRTLDPAEYRLIEREPAS